jgi:hypothetical protein
VRERESVNQVVVGTLLVLVREHSQNSVLPADGPWCHKFKILSACARHPGDDDSDDDVLCSTGRKVKRHLRRSNLAGNPSCFRMPTSPEL